jgi:hypothetical protein
MRRDRLRTTESPDGRKVATWQLIHSGIHILRVQNRADPSPAYRWPSKKPLPAAAPGLVLFDGPPPLDLVSAREAFPGHLDLWDTLRDDYWAALLCGTDSPTPASGE